MDGQSDDESVEVLLGQFATAWEDAPIAVGVTRGPDHLLIFQNAMSRRLFGPRPLGRSLVQSFPEADPQTVAEWDDVLRSNRAGGERQRRVAVTDTAGSDVVMRYVVAPYGRPDGPADGLVIMAVDLTAETQAARAARRAEVLARVSAGVNGAPDARAALQALTEVLVPEVADVAAVYVEADAGVAAMLDGRPGAAAGPEAVTIAETLRHLGAPPSDNRGPQPSPWQTLLAAGQVVLLPVGDPAGRAAVSADPRMTAWLAAADARTLAIVPLSVAGRLLGALVLLSAGGRPPFTDSDVGFLSGIAARAGAAVAQAAAHQVQADTSRRLQQALLPVQPPQVKGLQLAGRYLAGAQEIAVGGDWWDVVPIGDGCVAIGVGDVCGRGLDAAVIMGPIRFAMRTAGLCHLPPVEVLALLDRQIAELIAQYRPSGHEAPGFATALYGVLDVRTGLLTLANAGHLPAILHRPDGTTELIHPPPGPPLGLGQGSFSSVATTVPEGGTLLLYTDGLVEDRQTPIHDGIAHLRECLASGAGRPVEDWLDDTLAQMRHDGGPMAGGRDDIAALLIHRD